MIHQSLDIIAKEIESSSGNSFNVILNHLNTIKNTTSPNGVYLSLVNIQKEKNIGHVSRVKKNGINSEMKFAPIYINLYVMVSSYFSNYDTSLIHLNSALEFFQNKPYIDKYNLLPTLAWPRGVEKITFDWFNLEIDKLNQIWGINGGVYVPSFLYKIRMLKVEHNELPVSGPSINEINFDSILS